MVSDLELHALADASQLIHMSASTLGRGSTSCGTYSDESTRACGRHEPRRKACMCGCAHPGLRGRTEGLWNVMGQPMAGHNTPTGERRDSPTIYASSSHCTFTQCQLSLVTGRDIPMESCDASCYSARSHESFPEAELDSQSMPLPVMTG